MIFHSKTRFRPAVENVEARFVPSSAGMPAIAASLAGASAAVARVEGGLVATRAVSGEMNRARFPESRREISARDYPALGRDYEVLAPSTDDYNCVAHSLGIHDRWISLRSGPPGNRLAWLDRALGTKGYVRLTDFDTDLEPGLRKIVAYALVDRRGRLVAATHVARQSADGTWTSKLGDGPLIRHRDVWSLRGPAYGRPVAVYTRPA